MRPLTADELRGTWSTLLLPIDENNYVACLHPVAAKNWERMMSVDASAALELGTRIRTFLAEFIAPYLEQGYSNQAVDKLLAGIGAWTDLTPRLRWPYQSIPAAEADRLRPIAMERLPEFFLRFGKE